MSLTWVHTRGKLSDIKAHLNPPRVSRFSSYSLIVTGVQVDPHFQQSSTHLLFGFIAFQDSSFCAIVIVLSWTMEMEWVAMMHPIVTAH